jgi:hypothetical protein
MYGPVNTSHEIFRFGRILERGPLTFIDHCQGYQDDIVDMETTRKDNLLEQNKCGGAARITR